MCERHGCLWDMPKGVLDSMSRLCDIPLFADRVWVNACAHVDGHVCANPQFNLEAFSQYMHGHWLHVWCAWLGCMHNLK